MRVPLTIDLSLEAALRTLHDTERPFALVGKWAGGGALLGCDPVRADGGGDPFELLARASTDFERDPESSELGGESGSCDPEGQADPPGADDTVGGGWVGYIGYPTRVAVDRGQPSPPRPQAFPAASLAYYDNVVRLDRDGRWWFEALPSVGRATEIERRLRWWTERLTNPPQARSATTGAWRMVPSAGAHAQLVAVCRERIRAGDLFQANVCAQLVGRVEGEPLELFIRGVQALAPDWAAYLNTPAGAVLSLSPELFLQRRGRAVLSAPIKGTRPRPADPVASAAERAALERSDKDRAENVMIVDLIRNDLGRVCEPGTIVADPVAQVQAHTGVWHLVSEVRGRLRGEVDDGQLLRATFPPGSVTGAPKIAAIDVIAELESAEREVYTGAIGIASLGGLELNVAIRTFEIAGANIRLGVGGGVVADSDPDGEAAELATKAAPLLEAIAAPPPSFTDPRGRFIPVHRFGPFPTPRPDPARGVFESLLVLDGGAVRLDAHLARLSSSVAELYGLELPNAIADRIEAAAASAVGAMRMRIEAVPVGKSLAVEILALTPRGRRPAARLRAWSVPGGLGRHKWIDRRLIDAMEAACADQLPILVDADGYVLEASRANVFVLLPGGGLATPPDDGRILPGVARARVLAYARETGLELSTEPLALEQLLSADAVALTSALAQTPVIEVDGRELSRRPELLALLQASFVVRASPRAS